MAGSGRGPNRARSRPTGYSRCVSGLASARAALCATGRPLLWAVRRSRLSAMEAEALGGGGCAVLMLSGPGCVGEYGVVVVGNVASS